MLHYLRDPAEIYRRSFAMIRAETDLSRLPPELVPLVVRLVHACGMSDIVADLAWSAGVVHAADAALKRGAPVICDSRMVCEGIIRRRLPSGNAVRCILDAPASTPSPGSPVTTRSAAAMEAMASELGGTVVAIGNAPTALFRLLELLDEGVPQPAAIFAFPVGFIGAAEAKAALAENNRGVPYITLHGRRGGSALAAAAINALIAMDRAA